MKHAVGLLVAGLLVSPTLAQKSHREPMLIEKMRPGVTYEDCVTRCHKCGSGKNPYCIKNFCTGYPHRKAGAAPLPVICPQYS